MASTSLQRVGILTGGGDCPGLNAVIRAVAKPAMNEHGATVLGIEDGFEGLVEGRMRELSNADVSGIINLGGTVLGTSNKGDPWHYPDEMANGKIEIVDASSRALRNYKRWGLDALIAIGGDGTMQICNKLSQHGLNVVGVPKTIDNDLSATDVTFGYDSALAVATEAIDRLHTTAESHERIMVLLSSSCDGDRSDGPLCRLDCARRRAGRRRRHHSDPGDSLLLGDSVSQGD